MLYETKYWAATKQQETKTRVDNMRILRLMYGKTKILLKKKIENRKFIILSLLDYQNDDVLIIYHICLIIHTSWRNKKKFNSSRDKQLTIDIKVGLKSYLKSLHL